MRDEQTTHVASSREHVYTVGPGGGESGDLPVASVADDMKLKVPIPKTQKGNGKKLKTPNETKETSSGEDGTPKRNKES